MNTVFKSEQVIRQSAAAPRDIPLAERSNVIPWQPQVLLYVLMLAWVFLPEWLRKFDPTAAIMDQGIWLLLIISLIAFLLILYLCWWLLRIFWAFAGLTPIFLIFSQFKTLALWQQYVFFAISFYFLLFAVLGCLLALC